MKHERIELVCLFVFVVLTHAFSHLKPVTDSKWALHKAYSLYSEQNTDLSEWADEARKDSYRIMWIEGKPYSIFPDGAALSAVPLVALIDVVMRATAGRSYKTELDQWRIGDVQELWASMLVAMATVLITLSARLLGASRAASLTVALAFAFASSAYSTGSRALWSHSPSLLLNALIIWLFVKSYTRSTPLPWLLLGIVTGLAFVSRPTNAPLNLPGYSGDSFT